MYMRLLRFVVFVMFFWVPHCAMAELKIGGVVVTRTDAAFNQLTDNGADAVRTEIFDKMVVSSETFPFTDTAHASQHFRVRVAVISAIQSMAKGDIDFGFVDEDDGACPPNGLVANPLPGCTCAFKAPAGMQSSEAIDRIIKGTTRADCLCAVGAAGYIAYLNVYGPAWMDHKKGPGTLVVGDGAHFASPAGDKTCIPGDYFFMTNAASYKTETKEKVSLWSGENAVYVGNGKYTGLGCDAKDEDQLRRKVIAGYEHDTRSQMSPADKNTIQFTTHGRPLIYPFQP